MADQLQPGQVVHPNQNSEPDAQASDTEAGFKPASNPFGPTDTANAQNSEPTASAVKNQPQASPPPAPKPAEKEVTAPAGSAVPPVEAAPPVVEQNPLLEAEAPKPGVQQSGQPKPPTQADQPQQPATEVPPTTQPDNQPPAEPVVQQFAPVSWESPEFVQTKKPVGWYVLVAVFFGFLAVLAALTQQWLSIGLFALMGVALAIYANRKPRTLQYSVTNAGVVINQKTHKYDNFSAYYQSHDYNQVVFDLVPNKRFGTLVSLPAPHDQIDKIDEILSAHLPKTEHQDDPIDKLFKALRF